MPERYRDIGRVGPYTWEQVRPNEPLYQISRDGIGLVTTCDNCDAKAVCKRMWRDEKTSLAAMASDDPLALCRLGWHQRDISGGVRTFYRFMSGHVGERLNFWVGQEPIEWTATKIADLGPNAKPWTCAVCEKQIGANDEG